MALVPLAPAKVLPVARSCAPVEERRLASAVPDASPARDLDRAVRAGIARLTGGLAPTALADAYFDWAVHLAASPGKRFELAYRAFSAAVENGQFAARCTAGGAADPCGCALPQDRRFRAPEWQKFPFNVYAHSFLSIERWWELATTGVRGVSKQHEDAVTFAARQLLDIAAPSNFLPTNPAALARTASTYGMNLMRGASNFTEDLMRAAAGQGPADVAAFKVGEKVAVTPGTVVHRTALAEIIQYAPATDRIRPEPIVIVPAWIMKYYILDLSPANSLVKFLTEQGFTVFMISWKNPDEADRNIGFDDYRTQGMLPAIDAAIAITDAKRVHVAGYCLGGTLLAMAAAAMARDHDDRLASLTFLAAQIDFTDAGELMLFINESQVAFLEDMMCERGYLDSSQMSGAFQLLRSNDLIWSRAVNDYLMGQRSLPIDIMAWNADSTRMPYRMHSEYLRALFLDNDLAEGRFKVDGRPVTVHDIRAPIFALGTEQDHVAPWRSVFKLHFLTDTEVTFALTNGGHNAGVLSEPGHPNRHFRIATQNDDAPYVDPDTWLARNAPCDGSWWRAWSAWLGERSSEPITPPPLGQPGGRYTPLDDAPGRYVLMK
ncbi:MAG: poly-beta-hydroxybutyrate polymerase [Proteobacteria bacterium]|nr:MAG: poly-beta-hydroxybutyrate polymerase [Pseudomonadota bacterium]